MVMATQAAKPLIPRSVPGRFRWLVFVALACMVGLYSLQVTHFHSSAKHSLEYPKSQVERPAVLDALLPDLAASLIFTISYQFDTPDPEGDFLVRSPRLQPQSRAPPSPNS